MPRTGDKTRNKPGADHPTAEDAARARPGLASDRTQRLRVRAAWMYHIEGMTQSQIADVLGIGRVTVVRLLADARALHEVKVRIDGELSETVALERRLEALFGLNEAVVVPVGGNADDVKDLLGAAAGQYLSDTLQDGMAIGVGWGQTLLTMLASLPTRSLGNASVVSLLGTLTKAKRLNPPEFAWQFARRLDADCHLMAAPALVDSPETKQILVERCGLGDVLARARRLDIVLLSVGSLVKTATPFSHGFFTEKDREELIKRGAVGDLLYYFYDLDGRQVDYYHNDRTMSVGPDVLCTVPKKVLISGGADKAEAVLGALRLLQPTTLITDERVAARVMEMMAGS